MLIHVRLCALLSCCLCMMACGPASDGPSDTTGATDLGADFRDSLTEPDAGGDAAADQHHATDVSPPPGPVPNPTEWIGRVQVIEQVFENAGDNYGSVSAELRAAPLPTTQEPVLTSGDCVLLQGEPIVGWLCDEECPWGESACIDGKCVAYPDRQSTGPLTIDGLTEPVTLSVDESGSYVAGGKLPDNLFEPGSEIHVTSPGAAIPALDLQAFGVEGLVTDTSSYTIDPGEDMVITWEPGTDPHARIQVLLETGWHGSPSLTTIWCETEDDGELVVAAELTELFPIPSCGECEGSYISRFTRDFVDFGNGPVELFVASRQWFVAWWGGW